MAIEDGKSTDLVFAFGGAVKAIAGTSMVEGLLVPYGDPDSLDHDGEFFTAKTDYGLRLPAAFKLFYHHGMNEKVGRTPLAWAELERRADGIWFKSDFDEDLEWEEEERAKALKYRRHALKLIRDGELGASSGAAGHVVGRRDASKGVEIYRWPLAEASITATPSNSRTVGTVSLKAMSEVRDPMDDFDPRGECGECKSRSLAAQTETVLRSVMDLTADYSALATKEGRVLSASRHSRLKDLLASFEAFVAETEPRPRDADAPAPVMEAPANVVAEAEPAEATLTPQLWLPSVDLNWIREA